LLKNPGNLINRVLKFLYANNDKKTPTFNHENLTDKDKEFIKKTFEKVGEYVDSME